ncbi:hypothetical protein BH23ACT5_BH23ACT5_14830 [soil metagenome]
MTAASAVTLAAFLVAVFLLVVGILLWQEARRRPGRPEPVYVIDVAVEYIADHLDTDTRGRLRGGGVRRIIEWEVYVLQGLAQRQRWRPVETLAGGSDESIDYIVDQIATVHGTTYDRSDVAAVLRLEAEYLVSIGAVGEPVAPEEPNDDVMTEEEGEDE